MFIFIIVQWCALVATVARPWVVSGRNSKVRTLFANWRSRCSVRFSCVKSSLFVVVFRVCRSRTGSEAHPTHVCKPRFPRDLFEGAQLRNRRCGILAASPRLLASPCSPTLAEARLSGPVTATCQRRFHPPSSILHPLPSIFARPADPTTAERSIRSASEPNSKNTFQILILFPDFVRASGKPAANSSCFYLRRARYSKVSGVLGDGETIGNPGRAMPTRSASEAVTTHSLAGASG